MKIIKEHFIKNIAKTGLPESDAKKVFSLFLESIIKGLDDNKTINLKNFGVFKITEKKKNSFINPKTKKISYVKKKKKVRFSPSRNLIKYIND